MHNCLIPVIRCNLPLDQRMKRLIFFTGVAQSIPSHRCLLSLQLMSLDCRDF